MEKHIEILKNWLETSTKFFIDNYAEILAARSYNGVLETNEEQELHREGISYHIYLTMFIKQYTRLIDGYDFPERQLKKLKKRIENLPNFETTHPNLLI